MKRLLFAFLVAGLVAVTLPASIQAQTSSPYGSEPGTGFPLCPPIDGYRWPASVPSPGEWTKRRTSLITVAETLGVWWRQVGASPLLHQPQILSRLVTMECSRELGSRCVRRLMGIGGRRVCRHLVSGRIRRTSPITPATTLGVWWRQVGASPLLRQPLIPSQIQIQPVTFQPPMAH